MKKLLGSILIIIAVTLIACSEDSEQNITNSNMNESFEQEAEDGDSSNANDMNSKEATENAKNSNSQENDPKDSQDPERKVIYSANLEVEVKNFQKSVQSIESQVEDLDGYVVESNRRESGDDESVVGQLTVRVPQESFQSFIKTVEEGSHKVLDSSTSGEDVTEEYVDLESRLSSKEKVEKRLKSFMDEADKTEDLLDISNDLESIQEDIENITGEMEYLENKTELSTVTINLQETGTVKSDLNTWEKTGQQFMKSISFLLTFFSGLFVFIAGNIPVLVLIGIIVFAVYFIFRKRMRTNKK